jgi:glycosyltransferase involved in cell wall biosynthesis
MRILQIVESLNTGAVENWLVSSFLIAKKIRPEWQWDFYCTIDDQGILEDLVASNGGLIIKSPVTVSSKISFWQHLYITVRNGNYSVIHCHHDYLNGFYSFSFLFNKSLKITQIHNTDKQLPMGNDWLKGVLIELLGIINVIVFDKIVGVSLDTAHEFKFQNLRRPNSKVLPLGIDVGRFSKNLDIEEFNLKYDIPVGGKKILFLGRFTDLKNPVFVIELLSKLHLQLHTNYYALFVGGGAEEKSIRSLAKSRELSEFIRIIPWSNNVEDFFLCSDVFVFPRKLSPIEGFGLVMLEAQSAGLNILVSKGVSQETIVIPELVTVMDNIDNATEWAEEVLRLSSNPTVINSNERMRQSKYSIENSTQFLIELYER